MTRVQTNVVLRHIRGLAAAENATRLPDRQLLERFASAHEEAAFAALVRRHGPLVLGVCRRVLHNPHDAEDAFQATFLALARQAASAGRRASLGTWLYQVAYHVALRARKQTAVRRRREDQALPREQTDPLAEVTGRELLAVLDEELHRLPERLREPLVLCYLEGKTRDEAARELGWSLGTLKRRLKGGKEDLRNRLARRGLTLPAALLAAAAACSAVPAALAAATAKAAVGNAAAIPAHVAALVCGSLRAASAGKLKAAGAALLAVALVGAGLFGYGAAADATRSLGGAARPSEAPARKETPPSSGQAKPAEADRKETAVSGRVLGPDGKPAVGAKVYYLLPPAPGEFARARPKDRPPPTVEAVTDKNGRFSFAAPAQGGQVFVTAAGCGPAWPLKPGKLEDQPLRLARDDVAVAGRVLDLQGQPVAGVTVRVHALNASPDGTLDKWLAAVKASRDDIGNEYQYLPMFAHRDLAHFFPPVRTDKGGRFQIKGIGRERVASLIVEAPAIETRGINVVTRPGFAASNVRRDADQLGDERPFYYPPTFNHAAAPGRVVSGVVRDKLTRKPVAGAVVRPSENAPIANPLYFIKTTTDQEGRYRLTGLPRKLPEFRSNDVIVLPPDGELYLALRRGLPERDVKPAVFDFDLPRGVWLEGQVKDKATGNGVPAQLGYFVFGDGPDEAEARSLYIPPMPGLANWTDKDGRFRIVAAPYRGMLGARAIGDAQEHYRTGMGADKIKGGKKEGGTFTFEAYPYSAIARNFETLVEVKPAAGAKSVRCDILLDPGRAVNVQVRGPDGKPLEGVRAYGQFARDWRWSHELLSAEFSVYGLEPGQGRTLFLQHEGRNLVGRYEIKGDEHGPIAVTLQPAASVTGKVVDDNGRPLGHGAIMLTFRREKGGPLETHWRDVRTDAEGKFRIDGLLPGMIYSATVQPPNSAYRRSIFEALTLKAGESKDVGTVKSKKGDE
jgi:RNA polymerase sigma factor (sigma-70 family)